MEFPGMAETVDRGAKGPPAIEFPVFGRGFIFVAARYRWPDKARAQLLHPGPPLRDAQGWIPVGVLAGVSWVTLLKERLRRSPVLKRTSRIIPFDGLMDGEFRPAEGQSPQPVMLTAVFAKPLAERDKSLTNTGPQVMGGHFRL